MVENLQFIYEKEYWHVSALINTEHVTCADRICDIEALIKEKVENLTDEDLKKVSWNPEYLKKVKELGKNISLECKWVPFIENFPYYDENRDFRFNSLGFFEFEVEYYKEQPEKKKTIEAVLVQQIPTIVLQLLRDFCTKIENQYLFIDPESPIYVFVISAKLEPENIQWSKENVEKYKRVIGNWTEIYSGQWPDYSEGLYERRIQNNLSNRLSELHFIRRNSGFIYMVGDNYNMFFNSYMMPHVLEPTARIRSMLFALMALNESIDILFIRIHHQYFTDLKEMEDKIRNLKYLRGMIQTQMSSIYNELDYNRRQHYTSVLVHLINEFHLNRILDRISNKFEVFYDSMQVQYQKKMEENQFRVERGMNILNLLFGFGILADLGQILSIAVAGPPAGIFNWIVFIGINMFLLGVAIYFLRARLKVKKVTVRRTVDAVIVDEKGRVVIVERKYPPFRGQRALPGGFIEEGESQKDAIYREVKEETALDVEILKKIGIFDKPGRDPRGPVITNAFLCTMKGEIGELRGGDDAAIAKLVPLEELKGIALAFDHEEILDAAVRLILDEKLRGISPILDSEELLKSAREFLR